ncbi:hypothetical protein [Streptomyces sp. WAC 04229]|uniref:hypothetical protein n=1 Tax=Streptomyces sp. WAC 04229 TaxID=2203206 RepID=UPI0026D217C7|nr:hypothetical protein [Streptomyces sp. WAC 04229]
MPLHAGEHRAAATPRAGLHRAGPRRGGPDRRRVRLYGIAGVVVCAVVLPFAVASAGPPPDPGPDTSATVRILSQGGDSKASDGAAGGTPAPSGAASPRSPLPPGPATAVRCGPELTSPEGVEAQTCVLAQGPETWARTYYRNATGDRLEAVLSLMGPDGRSLRMRCAVSAEDAPGTCETPRERARGGLAGYTAVAEFASRAGYGPLLLRTGSNRDTGRDRRARMTRAPGVAEATVSSGTPTAGEATHLRERGVDRRSRCVRDPGHGKTRLLATGDAPATGLLER